MQSAISIYIWKLLNLSSWTKVEHNITQLLFSTLKLLWIFLGSTYDSIYIENKLPYFILNFILFWILYITKQTTEFTFFIFFWIFFNTILCYLKGLFCSISHDACMVKYALIRSLFFFHRDIFFFIFKFIFYVNAIFASGA